MESDNYVEVMGLLNAIMRCFNDNIGKVDLATLGQPLSAGDVMAAGCVSNASAEEA
jgi:hypothetical protein